MPKTQTFKCLASYFGDPGKFFSVVFQASTGKKLLGKITKKIPGPGNLMLNIPLRSQLFEDVCCLSFLAAKIWLYIRLGK